MTVSSLPLLLLLLAAHLLGDFIFQKSTWVDERYEKHLHSRGLYAHVGIHGVLALVVLSIIFATWAPPWQVWGFTILIGTTHFLIDLAKSYTPPGRLSWFLIDQLFHLSVIGYVWLEISNQWGLLGQVSEWFLDERVLLVLVAYFVVIWPFSIVVGLVCSPWTEQMEALDSLANAGKRIGQLERFLILTFILIGQAAAIGFLLAAKSLLRMGATSEENHRKINEYILVGTMTSFSISVAFGLVIKMLLDS